MHSALLEVRAITPKKFEGAGWKRGLTPPPRHEALLPEHSGSDPHSQFKVEVIGGISMDWKTIGKLWLIGLFIFFLGTFLIGCGSKNWSPTDPRLDTPDPANIEIIERWEITIDTEVQ